MTALALATLLPLPLTLLGAAPQLMQLRPLSQEVFAGDPPLRLELPPGKAGSGLVVRACGATARLGADRAVTLELGEDKAPRAVVVVASDGVWHGALFVPVASRRQLPVKATRGTMVEVRLGDRVFGPLPAGSGSLEVPVEIRAGEQMGVVVATDPGGNARQENIDLRTPKRPRLAAVLAGPVEAGDSGTIVVAVADAFGRPATASSLPVGEAARGRVAAAVSLGDGVWLLPYGAPSEVGPDEVMVRMPDDPGAGEDAVAVQVVLGVAAALEVVLPPGRPAPGARLQLTVVARDRGGNPTPTPPMEVTVEDGPPTAWEGHGELAVLLPSLLPPGAVAHLALAAGALRAAVDIAMQPGPASSADVVVDAGRRDACLRVVVRDEHGNPLGPDRVALRLSGAAAATLKGGSELETTVVAAEEARRAEVVVVADDRVLHEVAVDFAPPASAWLVGASVTAGLSHNGGRVWAPRLAVGLETSFGVGPVQLGAGVRVGYFYASGRSEPVELGGASHEVAWELNAVPVALPLRLRLPLGDRFGISAAGEPSLTWVQTRVDADFLPRRRSDAVRFGGAGELAGDVELGPGRLALALRYGSTQADAADVVGELDGFSAQLGYTWFFWDVGG